MLTASPHTDLSCSQGTLAPTASCCRSRPPSRSVGEKTAKKRWCSHSRKQVRCDAASLGVPCTNCVAFKIDCRIPKPKRKKAQSVATPTKDSGRYDKGGHWTCCRISQS